MGRACGEPDETKEKHPPWLKVVTARLQSWGMLGGAVTGALPVEVLLTMRSRRFFLFVNRSPVNKRVGHV